MIDVSQSVEHDHPHALEFLRKDCTNINSFFQKKGVATMATKQFFDFVTDPTINENNMEKCLEKLSEQAAARTEMTSTEKVCFKVLEDIFKFTNVQIYTYFSI